MQTGVSVLKVFLASPGDVRPEREAAEDLINQLNKSLGSNLGWLIRLTRWEDTSPGYGRPQEIINTGVDECDLFIGLLWERWGQPTGTYSSGFEEEYERARTRRKETGKPDIWLVFKARNPDKVSDPGAQLKKVLEFRDAQIALREVLFQEVSSVEDWKSKLTLWLLEYVLKLNASQPHISQPQAPASVPEAGSLTASASATVEAKDERIPNQLLQIAETLNNVLRTGNLESSSQEDPLTEFDVARLYLLSATLMAQRSTGDTIQTHEINLLYKYRDKLDFTAAEYRQLFRTLVVDQSDTSPGWFWFQFKEKPEIPENLLLLLARNDVSAQVRQSAFRLLGSAGIKVASEVWAQLLRKERDDSVLSEAYKSLGLTGDETSLSLLEANAAGDNTVVRDAAREARLSVLLRSKPAQALSELVEKEEYVSDKTLLQLRSIISAADESLLIEGITNQHEAMRELCARELVRRRRLTTVIAQKLTEDPSTKIRQIAFHELARQGQKFDYNTVHQSLQPEAARKGFLSSLLGAETAPNPDPFDSVALTFYQNQTADKVLEAVNWYTVDGPIAYKALAMDRFEVVSKDLRKELENGFADLRQDAIERMEREFGPASKPNISELQEYDDSIRLNFVAAALEGLVAHGNKSDIRFGRQYLTSERDEVKRAALRIVCEFGDSEDVPTLLQISKDAWGDLRYEAGVCALRFATNPFDIASELIKSRSAKLTHAGFDWLYKQDTPEVNAFFEHWLDDENYENRVRAVYYFFNKLKPEALANLLEAQFHKQTYYYNVVTWLDRLLYAAPILKESFARELKQAAT
jgi:HEAT repeat protein